MPSLDHSDYTATYRQNPSENAAWLNGAERERLLLQSIQSAALKVEAARRHALNGAGAAAGYRHPESRIRPASWLARVGRKIGELVTGEATRGNAFKAVSGERDLIRLEAERVGSDIFPADGGKNSFFSPDRHSFVFHRQQGESSMTLRYEIHPSGVIKTAPGSDGRLAYEQVKPDELERLAQAADAYASRVLIELYSLEPVPSNRSQLV